MQLMLSKVQRLDVVQRIPVEGWFKEARLHMHKGISSLAPQLSRNVYREAGLQDAPLTPCLLDLHALKCKHVFDILPATG
jgi:hypothetical protein